MYSPLLGIDEQGRLIFGPAAEAGTRGMHHRDIEFHLDEETQTPSNMVVYNQPPISDLYGGSCMACTDPRCLFVYKRHHVLMRFSRPLW